MNSPVSLHSGWGRRGRMKQEGRTGACVHTAHAGNSNAYVAWIWEAAFKEPNLPACRGRRWWDADSQLTPFADVSPWRGGDKLSLDPALLTPLLPIWGTFLHINSTCPSDTTSGGHAACTLTKSHPTCPKNDFPGNVAPQFPALSSKRVLNSSGQAYCERRRGGTFSFMYACWHVQLFGFIMWSCRSLPDRLLRGAAEAQSTGTYP